MEKILIVCTTDSMIWNFLIPHIEELEKKGYTVECACSRTGYFYSELEKNFKMNEIKFVRSPYSLKNLKAYRSLKKLIKDKNFDTIFCHEPVGGVMGRLAGKKMNCQIIYMAHGFHFYKGAPKSRKIYYFIEKYFSKKTDKLITINEEDYIAALNFKKCSCYKTNGIGIDIKKFTYNPDKFYLRNELGLNESNFLLLSVGELIDRKNHEVIIRAIAKLKNPEIHYIIAGEGEKRCYLEKIIKKLNVQNQIHLLGYRKDINSLCNSTDLFILPSIHEGLSVALMEAMACKKAIIASKIRGNIDLIDQDKGGILVDSNDVDGFSIAINSLYNDRQLIQTFGEYNYEKVKDYDINIVKDQIQKILIN